MAAPTVRMSKHSGRVSAQRGASSFRNAQGHIFEGINKYMLALAREQIALAFAQAQKEVDDLHQRTREGIETARLNGKQIGRPNGFRPVTKKQRAAKEIIRKHSRDFDGTLSDADVMKLAEISRPTYYKYKREMRRVSEGE